MEEQGRMTQDRHRDSEEEEYGSVQWQIYTECSTGGSVFVGTNKTKWKKFR